MHSYISLLHQFIHVYLLKNLCFNPAPLLDTTFSPNTYRTYISYVIWSSESPGTSRNTSPNYGYFIKNLFWYLTSSIEHVGTAWKPFHTIFLRDVYIIKYIFSLTFLGRRDLLIINFKKLDSVLSSFDLLALLYPLVFSSVQLTHHFFSEFVKLYITVSSDIFTPPHPPKIELIR